MSHLPPKRICQFLRRADCWCSSVFLRASSRIRSFQIVANEIARESTTLLSRAMSKVVHHIGVDGIFSPGVGDDGDDKIRVEEGVDDLLGDHARPAHVVGLGTLAVVAERVPDLGIDRFGEDGPGSSIRGMQTKQFLILDPPLRVPDQRRTACGRSLGAENAEELLRRVGERADLARDRIDVKDLLAGGQGIADEVSGAAEAGRDLAVPHREDSFGEVHHALARSHVGFLAGGERGELLDLGGLAEKRTVAVEVVPRSAHFLIAGEGEDHPQLPAQPEDKLREELVGSDRERTVADERRRDLFEVGAQDRSDPAPRLRVLKPLVACDSQIMAYTNSFLARFQ